ncbi:hypothetical protein M433DRAFT_237398 [Acidomyces richmondensis BFW]|nr:MAG: hypothetical protein FE78DRAFT_381838 [Acidomyces sp. 'richmondensis']KYG45821.1 hypothetical protein M433DRAFT_237398 [Acidomyces richmondensis BFW]
MCAEGDFGSFDPFESEAIPCKYRRTARCCTSLSWARFDDSRRDVQETWQSGPSSESSRSHYFISKAFMCITTIALSVLHVSRHSLPCVTKTRHPHS